MDPTGGGGGSRSTSHRGPQRDPPDALLCSRFGVGVGSGGAAAASLASCLHGGGRGGSSIRMVPSRSGRHAGVVA